MGRPGEPGSWIEIFAGFVPGIGGKSDQRTEGKDSG
jgi:hypothetical protein